MGGTLGGTVDDAFKVEHSPAYRRLERLSGEMDLCLAGGSKDAVIGGIEELFREISRLAPRFYCNELRLVDEIQNTWRNILERVKGETSPPLEPQPQAGYQT